jgi:hypothetical protein
MAYKRKTYKKKTMKGGYTYSKNSKTKLKSPKLKSLSKKNNQSVPTVNFSKKVLKPLKK